jgi:WD40 repeat protein
MEGVASEVLHLLRTAMFQFARRLRRFTLAQLFLIVAMLALVLGAASSAMRARQQARPRLSIGAHEVHFCPDGATLASIARENGREVVKLWDMGRKSLRARLDGNTVSTVDNLDDEPDVIRLWDVGSGKLLTELEGSAEEVSSVEFSPDSKRLAVAVGPKDGPSEVHVWELATRRRALNLRGPPDQPLFWVQYSRNGKMIAANTPFPWTRDEPPVRWMLWDAETGDRRDEVPHEAVPLRSSIVSPDGNRLIDRGIPQLGQTVRLWNLQPAQQLAALERPRTESHDGGAHAVAAFTPERTALVAFATHWPYYWGKATGLWFVARDRGDLSVWNLSSRKPWQPLQGIGTGFSAVEFSPDGTILATGRLDGSVALWDVATGHKSPLAGHTGWVENLQFSPKGDVLASECMDGSVKCWDVVTGQERLSIRGSSPEFSPDGAMLLTRGPFYDEWDSFKIWDVPDASIGALRWPLFAGATALWAIAWLRLRSAQRRRSTALRDEPSAAAFSRASSRSRL